MQCNVLVCRENSISRFQKGLILLWYK